LAQKRREAKQKKKLSKIYAKDEQRNAERKYQKAVLEKESDKSIDKDQILRELAQSDEDRNDGGDLSYVKDDDVWSSGDARNSIDDEEEEEKTNDRVDYHQRA